MSEDTVTPDNPPEPARAKALFDRHMLEALVCPLTHAVLHYDVEAQELISKPAQLAFPIRGGIPILLEDEARRIET